MLTVDDAGETLARSADRPVPVGLSATVRAVGRSAPVFNRGFVRHVTGTLVPAGEPNGASVTGTNDR